MNPGDLIHERFVIERFVARGGMGEVYRAIDQHDGKPVALKLMTSEDDKLTERFVYEARALLELDHPAIVRYVAHGAAPGVGMYLAMEWLDGATLSRRLRRQPLSLDESLRMCARIADGLGAAHALGMVHRDIKPGNLFLVGRKVEGTKILDFGLVRNPWQPITATGAGMGTPDYMAPEQARCEKVGPSADVFALGCVLYRCVSGKTAFQGEHVKAILAKIATFERPPRLSEVRHHVPAAVDELCARFMDAYPDRRPVDGSAAAEAIRAVRASLVAAERARTAEEPPALTTREQRPVAVLFVDLDVHRPLPRAGELVHLGGSLTSPTMDIDLDEGDAHAPITVPAAPVARRATEDPVIGLIRQAVEPLGGKVVPLVNGSLVITLSGGAAAAELAGRAAQAALAIRKLVPGAAISLATRQVIVDDDQAAGPVIDGAAAIARSRRIRIDKRTRELLPEHFDVEGDSIEGLALVGERPPEAVPRRLLGRAMPYVGRQALLRQLEAAIHGALDDGGAAALVVVGDSGMGKSRLRAELLASVRERRRVGVVLAAGDARRSGVPGGLVARALRAYLGLPDGTMGAAQMALRVRVEACVAESERARVATFLGQLVGLPMWEGAGDDAALRAAQQDAELMAEQKRRAFADWLVAECARRPLFVVVDDLQWADPVSVELIGAALKRAREVPLVVVGFARPELGRQFPRLDEQWGRQELRLEPLRPAACAELARAALGDDADVELVRQLVERSAGNPFYLEELIRAAVSPEPERLPPSLVASTQLRIGRRPPRARQVLRAASVFGRTFWAGGVAALLGGEMARVELDEWLAVLERDELIEARGAVPTLPGEAEYVFRHDLLRDAAYEMLTAEDRRMGHRLAGAWLVEHGEPDALVLAEHFAGGGVTEQAVSWFETAAHDALASGADDVEALRKAATYYRRAGQTSAAARADAGAAEHFERAAALLGSLDPITAARTYLELAEVRERTGERERALDELRVAEASAGTGNAPVDLRVDILIARAQLEMRGGEGALERSRRTAEAALALARGAHQPALEARALMTLAVTLARLENADAGRRATELVQRALTLVAERGERGALAMALWRLGNAFLVGNDLARAERHYTDALASAEAGRDELLAAHCTANLGLIGFRRFALDEAIERMSHARDAYQHLGHRTRELEATLNLGFFHHVHGDSDLALPLFERVLAQAQDDWILTTMAQENLADVARLRGDEVRAQQLLGEAARTCERVGVPRKQAVYLGLLAESLWTSGDAAGTARVLEQSARAAKALTLSHALLLLHLGPLDHAIDWLERFARSETDPHRSFAARLGQARARLWIGQPRDALAACDALLAAMEPTPVPRFRLPVVCLRASLVGDVEAALLALARVREFCAPHEYAEAALDVGEDLARRGSEPEPLVRYLSRTAACQHLGIGYRLDDLRARLHERLGDAEAARASLARAHAGADRLWTSLPEDYRRRFEAHPFVVDLRRVRAVP